MAKCRISAAKDCMLSHDNRIVFVDKELALLRAKVDDQENTGRRKNLRIEGSESVVQFLTKILPKWLDLTPDSHFEIERAHRSLGPIPGADRPPSEVFWSASYGTWIRSQNYRQRGKNATSSMTGINCTFSRSYLWMC